MPSPAVAAIARWEWVRRWRALLAFGIVGGVLGGLVVAGVVLTRRTVTAPDRLFEEVAPGDLHLRLFQPDLLQHVLASGEAESVWAGGIAVGRIEGATPLSYAAVMAPTVDSGELLRPVIVDGRPADPTDAGEVVIAEEMGGHLGLGAGDRISLAMLSVEEMFQFDTGFGDPDGPTVELDVVGVARVPPGTLDGTPVLGTPAFAAAHADLFSGYDVRLALRGGDAAFDAAVAEFEAMAAASDLAADDFPPVSTSRPRDGTDDVKHSSRVLFAGLVATVAVAALAVTAGLAQAWARHHGAAAHAQHVEAALGLTTGRRVLARAYPAAVAAAIAVVVAAGIGALASWKQPLGGLRRMEPDVGWRLDVLAVVSGGVAVGLATLLLAAAMAWRAGRPPTDPTAARRARHLRAAPGRGGWPLAGAAFALTTASRRRTPVRASLAAAVVGVAGLVGSVSFDASLERLVDTPRRWGWDADFTIADTTDAVVDELLTDSRLAAVSDLYTAEVRTDRGAVDGYAVRKRSGDTGWVLQAGRQPASPTELVLGRKLADELRALVGDRVEVGGRTFTVVGVGLGPAVNLEDVGGGVLFTVEGLDAVATTNLFREAIARVAPGIDAASVVADYSRYETSERTLPSSVRDVRELGALPTLLGAFLALLAAIALIHALLVVTTSRARDLAVLRALGATPRQAGLSVVAMAVTTAVVGIAGGVPLGCALSRLLWGEVARSIGVQDDVLVPWTVVLVAAGAVACAGLLAVVPAWRAARQPVGPALRAA